MHQDEVFLKKGEGDAWFRRNESHLRGNTTSIVSAYLSRQRVRSKQILEIGCSNGYLLAPLAARGATAWGIDPSLRAIADGRKRFPDLNLVRGISHDLSRFADSQFNIVILSFVLHWIDRAYLLRTIAEVDRVLKTGGLLVLQDFDPDTKHKIPYKHRKDEHMYTYKQRYAELFLASGLYSEKKILQFDHHDNTKVKRIAEKGNDSCMMASLRKIGSANYPTRSLS